MSANLAIVKSSPALPEVVPDTSVFHEPGFYFEPKSLRITPGVKIGRWLWAMRQLSMMGESVMFWIGDGLQYGEHEYGEMYAQAEAETGLDKDTLQDAVYVARNVKSTLRNVLSFSHHKAVAPLNPPDQKRWLTEAKNEGYSYRELRHKIQEWKREPGITADTPKTDYLDPHFKRFLVDLENVMTSQLNTCPYDPFKREIAGFIRKVKNARHRSPESDCASVKKRVDEGCCTVEEIEEEVALSRPEIKKFFLQMVGSEPCARKPGTSYYSEQPPAGEYEWRPIGQQTEMARGGRSYGIFRIDAPSGDDFIFPHTSNGYESREETE